MDAVTYRVARIAGEALEKDVETASSRKGWFARFMDALAETRIQQAHREIMRHAHLLPYSLDERGNRLVKTGAKDMPFGGW